MLTADEQNTVKEIEHVIDHYTLFERFDHKILKSGTEKLTSPDGNLVIRISIIEKK